MAPKQPPKTGATQPQAAPLQEALAKVKAATERHDAIVAVMSRLRASPQERRLAQSQAKKVERELHDARRILREAEAAAGTAQVGSAR